MSESTYAKIYIKNNTGSTLNLLSDSYIEWGKYEDSPPSQIPNGNDPTATDGVGYFRPCGRKGSATGTEGKVYYQDAMKAIFVISWDIPYSKDNTASITADFSQATQTNYLYRETNSEFDKTESPSTSGSPDLYFQIQFPEPVDSADVNTDLSSLSMLSNDAPIQSIDPAGVINNSCDEYDDQRVAEIFNGRTTGTIRDVIEHSGVPVIDRLRFILECGLISERTSAILGADFIEQHLVDILSNSEHQTTVQTFLAKYRETIAGDGDEHITDVIEKMRAHRGVYSSKNNKSQAYFYDAVFALIRVLPANIAANVASSLRNIHCSDKESFYQETLAQFEVLKKAVL